MTKKSGNPSALASGLLIRQSALRLDGGAVVGRALRRAADRVRVLVAATNTDRMGADIIFLPAPGKRPGCGPRKCPPAATILSNPFTAVRLLIVDD
jgi:hypothetical protein